MDSNPPQLTLGKTVTKIIKVMQNIGFTTSPDRTTITQENLGASIEQMAHEFQNICS